MKTRSTRANHTVYPAIHIECSCCCSLGGREHFSGCIYLCSYNYSYTTPPLPQTTCPWYTAASGMLGIIIYVAIPSGIQSGFKTVFFLDTFRRSLWLQRDPIAHIGEKDRLVIVSRMRRACTRHQNVDTVGRPETGLSLGMPKPLSLWHLTAIANMSGS